MDVVVLCEERLERTADGVVWGLSSYQFWSRYLQVFDGVRIVARVRDVHLQSGHYTRATGLHVTAHGIPHYLGPLEYLKVSRQVTRAVRSSYKAGDAVIMRLGCHFARPLHSLLRRLGSPYGVEVVGDPHEVFAPGVVEHPLRPFLRWWFTRQQQRYCAGATAAAYVTQRTLQKRYPCGAYVVGVSDVQVNSDLSWKSKLSTHFSSVSLDEGYFQAAGPRRRRVSGPLRLVTVGSLEQLYKGTDILLQAVANCVAIGIDLTLTIVGEGRYRTVLEAGAHRLGVAGRVVFTGALPGAAAVRERLDEADLFVLPSRTEGLPRALIEAMAAGLPCIASAVGGVPELLPAEDLFPSAHTAALAGKIAEVALDEDCLERMSARNVLKAREYREPVLRERRVEFYRHLRGRTEDWARLHAST